MSDRWTTTDPGEGAAPATTAVPVTPADATTVLPAVSDETTVVPAAAPVPDGTTVVPVVAEGAPTQAVEPVGAEAAPPSPLSPAPSGHPGLPLSLERTAALVGQYRWIENALYRILGQWVVDVPIAGVRLHLDAQSMRHAWHAELWGARLPVRDGVDPDAYSVPSSASAGLFAMLTGEEAGVEPSAPPWPVGADGADGAGDRIDNLGDGPVRAGALPRLAALFRVVLPRLVTTYELHLAAASTVTDGPVARALTLVLNDEREDWRAGERLLERIVVRPHDVVACHEFLQRVETAVVAAGGGPGLVPLPPVLRGS